MTLALGATFLGVIAAFLLGYWLRGLGNEGPTLGSIESLLLETRIFMADVNERITAATTAIKAALSNIAADIAAIKARVGEGAPTEETLAALEQLQADAQALADENPDAA